MKEDLTFDTIPAKFCGMVEEYRLELAKKNWIDLQLDVSLPWKTIFWIHETVLISKKFWFIQRLVKNGKIDFDKCWICYEINSTHDHYNLEERQDLWLIMLLSISHTPIEDLVSYLK